MMKVLYIFDSVFQTNIKVAKEAEKLFDSLAVDYKIRRVERVFGEASELPFMTNSQGISDYEIVNKNDLAWADGYIVASPIHSGMISAAVKYFFDSYHEEAASGAYLNKGFMGIVTGGILHGGAENALEQLYSVAMQWGCLVMPSSLAVCSNNPYGLSFIVNKEHPFEETSVRSELAEHVARFCDVFNALSINQNKSSVDRKQNDTGAYRITDIFND